MNKCKKIEVRIFHKYTGGHISSYRQFSAKSFDLIEHLESVEKLGVVLSLSLPRPPNQKVPILLEFV